MKNFWDFLAFVIMRELDQPDSIVRNYLIECDYAGNPIVPSSDSMFVRLGLGTLGFKGSSSSVHTDISDLLAVLRDKKYVVPTWRVLGFVAEFYNYHRIKTGEVRKWPKRSNSL